MKHRIVPRDIYLLTSALNGDRHSISGLISFEKRPAQVSLKLIPNDRPYQEYSITFLERLLCLFIEYRCDKACGGLNPKSIGMPEKLGIGIG
jgi:hypothetical protein